MRPAVVRVIAVALALSACGQRAPVLVDLDASVDASRDAGRDGGLDGGLDGAIDAFVDAGADAGERCPMRAPTPEDPLRGHWDARFHLPGVGGTAPTDVSALVIGRSGELYIGGRFAYGGSVPAPNVVRFSDADGFTPVGEGLPRDVAALAVDPRDGALVAAAEDGDGAMVIARFGGVSWSVLATVEGRVATMQFADDGTLWVGGSFERIGGVVARYLARFDGTAWAPLAEGPDGAVRALLVEGERVCVGGHFTLVGSTEANSVACWDGAWTALSLPQPHYSVEVLARDRAGALVAGGHFDLDPSDGDEGGSIARFRDGAWELVGGGVEGTAGPGYVEGVVAIGGELYVAGSFVAAGGVRAESVARWDGARWHDLGGAYRDVGFFLESRNVTELVLGGDRIYAGGLFTRVGETSASHVAYLDVAGWHSLIGPGQSPAGVSGFVDALAARGDCGVYIGGAFQHVGSIAARNVARVDALGAHALGAGLDGVVRALDVDRAGRVYAGGDLALGHLAMWDGARWQSVGGGVDGTVYAVLAASDGTLFVGGAFGAAGGEVANVAAWDGARWSSLGGGVSGPVHALLELPDGRVVVAGSFERASDGTVVNDVAVWDGASWSALGEGLPGNGVRALALYAGALVAGGSFDALGDAAGRGVARWDGARWSTIGAGLARRFEWAPVYVNGLAAVGDVLVAVGDLAVREGGEDVRAAYFDGTAWAPFGEGLTDIAEAALVTPDAIWIGGTFTSAGGVPAVGLARWRFDR